MHTNWIQDTHALLNSTDDAAPTRRLALQTALGLGYAAAAMPLMAQTAIQTSGAGLVEGEVMIDVNGFKMPAYRSAPQGKTNLPVVLVISEIFGVHEYIADVTRRFAKAGYLAIAPELFVRQGDPSAYGEIAKLQAEVISKVPDAQVMADLDATLQWAAHNGGNANRAAITGFCWVGASHGCMRRTTQSSKRVSLGMAVSKAKPMQTTRSIPSTWRPHSKRLCSVCTVGKTQAFL